MMNMIDADLNFSCEGFLGGRLLFICALLVGKIVFVNVL